MVVLARPAPSRGAVAMSLDNARTAYPILIGLAHEMSQALRERRPARWVTYDEFCQRCRDVGLKETPRTVAAKVLRPLQAVCFEKHVPDLSALIIQKPKPRSDFGNYRPSDGWWELYVELGETTMGDVPFWFKHYQRARDYTDWPAAPFF
jgi:hypothetical protein